MTPKYRVAQGPARARAAPRRGADRQSVPAPDSDLRLTPGTPAAECENHSAMSSSRTSESCRWSVAVSDWMRRSASGLPRRVRSVIACVLIHEWLCSAVLARHPRRVGFHERHRHAEIQRRQRRRPSPSSNPGDRRRQTPQRSRSRQRGRAPPRRPTPTSPIHTSSTTARCRPSSRAHTPVPRTSSAPPGVRPLNSRNPRTPKTCAPLQTLTSTHGNSRSAPKTGAPVGLWVRITGGDR